eukprot:6116534-Prymnesium_polylepis.1
MPGEASPSAQRRRRRRHACCGRSYGVWARPLPLPAQVLRDRWGALLGANMAKRFARLAAIADENTHVSWTRLADGHAAVLQRAWRASAAAA